MDSVTLSHAFRCDCDHLATVDPRHAHFVKVKRSVAGNITRGTDAGRQEVLDRFFRVRDNNVEDCWTDQSNTTGEAQRERIVVVSEMEYVHLLKIDSENEDRCSVHGSEIQHNL